MRDEHNSGYCTQVRSRGPRWGRRSPTSVVNRLRLVRCCRIVFVLLCLVAFLLIATHDGGDYEPSRSLTAALQGEWTPSLTSARDIEPDAQSHLGVFILVDLTTLSTVNASMSRINNCTKSELASYHQYVLYYESRSPSDADRFEAESLVNELTGCWRPSTSVVRLDRSNDAAGLNLVLMDAYLDHAIDFYLVVFTGTPSISVRQVLQRATSLRDDAVWSRHSKGVTLLETNDATSQQLPLSAAERTSHSLPAAAFLSRTHFDIFGRFFPLPLPDLPSAVAFISDLYMAANLTNFRSTAGEVVGRSFGVASKWPELFQQELDTLHRYVSAENAIPCLRCRPRSTRTDGGLSVISMSLYGEDRRYTMGAVRNAQLAPINFPGWQLRFYVERGPKPRYGAVPESILSRLQQLGVEFVDAPSDRLAPMMWRFTVLDDSAVDTFIARDSDSRLTRRDAAVVADWLRQDSNRSMFHCVRDHPSHSGYSISGGLWGARRAALTALFGASLESLMSKYDAGYIADMNFLGEHIWPRVQGVAYCHDSYSCDRFPGAHAFPVTRIGAEHIGQVYDQLSVGRQIDLDILRSAPVNPKCVPPS